MKSEWQVKSLLIIGLSSLFTITLAEITRECERALAKDTKILQVENEKCEQEFGDDLPCGNLCLLRAKGFIDSETDEFESEKYLKYMKIYPRNVVQKLHKEIPKCEEHYVPVPAPSKDADRDTCKQNEKFLACLENALMNACKKPNVTHAVKSSKSKSSSRRKYENENAEDDEDEEEETHHHHVKKVSKTANRHAGHGHGLKKKSKKTVESDDEAETSDNESEREGDESESGNNEDADLQSENSALPDNDNDLDEDKTEGKRKKRQSDPGADPTTPDPGAETTAADIPIDESTTESSGGGGGGEETTPAEVVDPPPPDVTGEPPLPGPDAPFGDMTTEGPIGGPLPADAMGAFGAPPPANEKLAFLQGLTDDLRNQLTEDRDPPPEQIQDLENVIREIRDHPEAFSISVQQIHAVGTVLDNLREKMKKQGRSALGIDRIDDVLAQIKGRVPDDFTLPAGDEVTVIPEIHFPSEVAGGGGGFGGTSGFGGENGGGAGGPNLGLNEAQASARRKEKWIKRRAELVARRGTTKFGKNLGGGEGGDESELHGPGGGLGGGYGGLGGLGRYGRIKNRLGRLRGRLGRGRFGRRGRGRLGRRRGGLGGLRGLKRRGRHPVSGNNNRGAYRRYGSQVFEQKLLIEVKNPNNIKDFQVTFKGIPNEADGN